MLGVNGPVQHAVTHFNHHPLLPGQLFYQRTHLLQRYPAQGLILHKARLRAQNIQKGDIVAFPVRAHGIGQAHVPPAFPGGAQQHPDFIFNAPGGIGGKGGPRVWPEGVHRLDQPQRAHGHQILPGIARNVVFPGIWLTSRRLCSISLRRASSSPDCMAAMASASSCRERGLGKHPLADTMPKKNSAS